MKLATVANPKGNSSYAKTIEYFSTKWFGNNIDGKEFFNDLGVYLDEIRFPADKLKLDPYYGSRGRFDISIIDTSKTKTTENHVWCEFEVYEDTKIVSLYNCASYDFTINREKCKEIINDFLNQFNKKTFEKLLKENGIKKLTDKIDVVMVAYAHGKPTDKKKTIHGTVKEILARYSEANDALRYINGAAWRFEDKNFEKLCDAFKQANDGNLSLDAALRRGATID